MGRHVLLGWRGVSPPRVEAAAVMLREGSLDAHGTSLTAAYRLGYRLETGAGWVTRRLDVRVEGDGWWRTLALRRDEAGRWSADREGDGGGGAPPPLPALDGALDCDLGLCPLTNTMPILRHDLVGSAQRGRVDAEDLLMAWVSVPDLAVSASRQRYRAADAVEEGGGALVHFESEGFSTTLEVDGDGLVLNYPGLARRVEGLG
jgi:hypothetical protein